MQRNLSCKTKFLFTFLFSSFSDGIIFLETLSYYQKQLKVIFISVIVPPQNKKLCFIPFI